MMPQLGETAFTAALRDALKAYTWTVMDQHRDRRAISADREHGDGVKLMLLRKVTAL